MLRKNKMTVKEIEKLIKDGEKINIEFCKKNLVPLGINLYETNGDSLLPFKNNEFGIIINKHGNFNNIQQEVPYFYKQGMNCFFIFLKLFQKYDIIKSVKDNKK